MADSSGGASEDIMGGFFGGSPGPSGPKRQAFSSKEEKGIPWEAKIIDGNYYIPLSQVAELLEANGVLPKVTAGIKRRVETGPPQT